MIKKKKTEELCSLYRKSDKGKVWISEESLPDFEAIYQNAVNLSVTNHILAYNYLMEVIFNLKKELESVKENDV